MKRIALVVAIALVPGCVHSQQVTRRRLAETAAGVGLIVGTAVLAAMSGANQCSPDPTVGPCSVR